MEYYEEITNNSKIYSDRYKSCNILRDVVTGESLLATREVNSIINNSNDKYHVLKSHEVCRLDILAHKYYKNPLLWWVIAQANDIYDPFQKIRPGRILRIPSIETLYGNNGILL